MFSLKRRQGRVTVLPTFRMVIDIENPNSGCRSGWHADHCIGILRPPRTDLGLLDRGIPETLGR
jgi:hypothetical protein